MLRVSIAALLVVLSSACSRSDEARVVVRDLDDITVLSPAEVAAIRATIPASDGPPETIDSPNDDSPSGGVENASPDTTIPLNQDDRPAELKLFDAYANFKGCIEDAGETIRGNLQDPNNPAYQDPAYAELVQTCAARSKIVDALRETAQARGDLSPDEVRSRNEAFETLSECLKKRGWTIETRVDEKGLINPSRFEGPDGTLDQRDLDQCLSDTGISDAIEAGE